MLTIGSPLNGRLPRAADVGARGRYNLRIAYLVTATQPIGGAQVHVRDLARSMCDLGHEAVVLTGGTGSLPGLSPEVQVSVPALGRAIRPTADVKAFWQIRTVLKEFRPQLLSTHSSKAGWLGRMAARSLGIPSLFTAHGWAFTEGVPQPWRSIYLCAERVAGPLAARIITVSEHDRELALRYRVAAPDRVITVHNGVPDVSPSLMAKPEIDPPRLVMVARFGEQKDHTTLIQALAGLQDLPWSLDLVGGGEGQEVVQDLVHRVGLGERVRFLGPQQDVARCLAQSQVFVLASRWEGFPRSILEAMRAGLPVVATDVGGVREAVDRGKTGLLVRRGDVSGLRTALYQLLKQPEMRRRLGQAGRVRYKAYFTFERMFAETFRVYESVLKERGLQN